MSILRDPTKVILLLLVIFAGSDLWERSRRTVGIDYYHFWVIPKAISELKSGNIYSPDFADRVGQAFFELSERQDSKRFRDSARQFKKLEPTASPFQYWVLSWFVRENYDRGFLFFQGLSLVLSAVATLWFCKSLSFSFSGALAGFILFSSWFEPFKSDLRVANVNRILLAWIIFYLWVQRRDDRRFKHLLSGFVLGFGITFKPILVFVAIMAGLLKLANLQFKELRSEVAGSLLAATAAIVSSSLFFGSAQIWPQWFQGISVIAKEPYATKDGNYAPVNVLGEQTGMASEIFLTLFSVILIASLAWAFLPSLRSFGRRIDAGESREGEGAWKERAQPDSAYAETVLMAGIGMLIYLLTAPLVWLHYYLLTTPLLLFMFRSESTRSVRLLALIATLFIGLSPIMKMFSVYDAASLANMVICGLFLLTALSIRELRELRSGRAAPPLGSGSAKSGASLDSGA